MSDFQVAESDERTSRNVSAQVERSRVSLHRLQTLLGAYRGQADELDQGQTEVWVTSITHDSRCVTPGALYVALAGRVTHGARFILNALERGATAIALPTDTPSELLRWMGSHTKTMVEGQRRETRQTPGVIWLTPHTARREMAWLSAWVYRTIFNQPRDLDCTSDITRSEPILTLIESRRNT